MTFEVTGYPLREVGLESAVIVNADGTEEPFPGFVLLTGKSIYESVLASLKPGQRIVFKGLM